LKVGKILVVKFWLSNFGFKLIFDKPVSFLIQLVFQLLMIFDKLFPAAEKPEHFFFGQLTRQVKQVSAIRSPGVSPEISANAVSLRVGMMVKQQAHEFFFRINATSFEWGRIETAFETGGKPNRAASLYWH